MKTNKLLFLTTLILLLTTFNSVRAQQKIMVVAASDLKFALDSIIKVYQERNPNKKVQVTYGSSGKFFEQIQNGAPYDIFFSADKSYPQKLKEKGLTSSNVKIYGIGRIVIWSKKTDPNTTKINSLLLPQLNKIAIANPDHAPYGKKAVESMNYYKVYDKVKNKLVFGENIAQTTQFVQLGAADIGIIALSLALSPNMKKEKGKYYIIPDKSHEPLEQGYVILKNSANNSDAVKFYNFIATPTAVAILKHFGFTQKTK